MNKIAKISALVLTGALALGGLTACYDNSEYDNRKSDQKTTTLKNSLEIENLQKKLERQNKPDAVRYVYIMNFGQVVGYYVIKGKVSSNASQIAPEEEVIRYFGEPNVLDSAQDDGTYGAGDPGIFFFLADGTLVETSLDYIESDQPLKIDVPRLGG